MKKCKHTPGPWRFHEQGDANQYCLLTNDKRWVIAFSQNGELHTPDFNIGNYFKTEKESDALAQKVRELYSQRLKL